MKRLEEQIFVFFVSFVCATLAITWVVILPVIAIYHLIELLSN